MIHKPLRCRLCAGRRGLLLGVAALCMSAAVSRAQEEPNSKNETPKPVDLAIRETQISVEVDTPTERSRFQASILVKGQDHVTILTAAHCLSDKDCGKSVRISRGDDAITARVGVVLQNPSYRDAQFGDSPGADNAVATFCDLSKEDRESNLFRELKTVVVTEWPLSDLGGRPISARIHDQFGKEHVVRAGNYSNPKWLEWGPSYRPLPGDSGSGVFVFPRTPSGKPKPVLIGVVVDRSDVGGGASLVSKRYRWLAELPSPQPRADAKRDEPKTSQ